MMNHNFLKDKKVLVTGVCGSVGSELVRQLLEEFQVGSLIGLDHNETALVFLSHEFSNYTSTNFFLCDVRDKDALMHHARDVDVIFHTAAYKHVISCERSPLEAVQTNILGVQNVIEAAIENQVRYLLFTSSDKAVNPTSVMGTSKLMGERLISASTMSPHLKEASFLSTRFGNVLGTRGSVIPIFQNQIKNGGPVTLTDPEMTRFIMSQADAVRMVIESLAFGQRGDVLITKMPVIRISDLAEIMIQECAPLYGRRPEDIEIQEIGPKPGEKMYEELMNTEETRRAIELEKYFVVRQAFQPLTGSGADTYPEFVTDTVERPYTSINQVPLSKVELSAFLHTSGLLEDSHL